MSQSNGKWTLYSEKNLELNSLYHLFPFLHCSWDSGVEERISWIRKPCKNTSVEHSEICLLNSWKYILCACANTSGGVAAAGVWEVGQKEITFMQSGCSHSFSQAFSKINILHRQIFPPHSLFLIKAHLWRSGSKVIEDPLLTFADAGNLVEVVLRVVVEVGSVPLVF